MASFSTELMAEEFEGLGIGSEDDELMSDIFDAVVRIYKEQVEPNWSQLECVDRIRAMSSIYTGELGRETQRVDFSYEVTQWTYMYMYLLRHFQLMLYAFRLLVAEKKLVVDLNYGARNMCVIGGGPGTDVLGYIMFLIRSGCSIPIAEKINVLDKFPNWRDSWNTLRDYLPETYKHAIPPVEYHEFNYCWDTLSQDLQRIVGSADIVTMTKSLSSAAAWLIDKTPERDVAEDGRSLGPILKWHSVYDILKNMRTGALLLYIDNTIGPQREILMDAASCLSFEVMYRGNLPTRVPYDIFSSSHIILFKTLKRWPCLKAGTNEVILLRKTGLPFV